MTKAQHDHVKNLVEVSSCSEVHHGDCQGSDSDFHDIIERMAMGITIYIHPSNDATYRAFRGEGEFDTIVLPPKPPLIRNHDIVDVSNFIIATPAGPEIQRSGTWATVRYARSKHKPIVIVMPDGSVG